MSGPINIDIINSKQGDEGDVCRERRRSKTVRDGESSASATQIKRKKGGEESKKRGRRRGREEGVSTQGELVKLPA